MSENILKWIFFHAIPVYYKHVSYSLKKMFYDIQICYKSYQQTTQDNLYIKYAVKIEIDNKRSYFSRNRSKPLITNVKNENEYPRGSFHRWQKVAIYLRIPKTQHISTTFYNFPILNFLCYFSSDIYLFTPDRLTGSRRGTPSRPIPGGSRSPPLTHSDCGRSADRFERSLPSRRH